MASGSAWFFPPPVINGLPNTDARTQAIAPYSLTKIGVAGFASAVSGASMFGFDTQAQTWGLLQNPSLGQSSQYVATVASSGAGLIVVGADGLFTSFTSGGSIQISVALGAAGPGPFSSVLFSPTGGSYAVDYEGHTYHADTDHMLGSVLPASGSAVVPKAAALTTIGMIAGLVPALNEIGIASASAVYSSTLSGPSGATTLECITASGSTIAVGGISNATLGTSGQNFIIVNPANPVLILAVSNTVATMMEQQSTYSDVWTPITQLTGITGAATSGDWSTNGTQAFLSDPTNSHLQILNYTAGTLSISQTLTLAGIGQVAAASDGTSLLACAANEVTVFQLSGATWSQITANTISVSGASCIVPLGASMLVGCATGVAVLTENAGTWSAINAIVTGFPVTSIAVDSFNNVYAANATHLAVITGGVIVGTGTMSGSSAVSMIVSQAQVAIMDSTAGLIRVIGSNDGVTWTQQSTMGVAGTSLCQASATIFAARTSTYTPLMFKWDAPYTVIHAKMGTVGVYNGSTWSALTLGVDKVPSAISIDPSGNIWAACTDNSLYELSAAGSLVSTGAVPNYPGESTPMGVSSLAFAYGHLYAGCGMFGGLVQVS